MNRYAKPTFAAALALGALSALPASAADIVVKLAGKSPAQISTEVRTAAKTICKEDVARWTQIDMNSCIDFVFNDAIAQLPPTIVIPAR